MDIKETDLPGVLIVTPRRHGNERGLFVETFKARAMAKVTAAAAGARNPGLQRKPDDRWVLPLSPNEHRRQRAMGEVDYWPSSRSIRMWSRLSFGRRHQTSRRCGSAPLTPEKNAPPEEYPTGAQMIDVELARELQPALCTVIATLLEDEYCAIVSARPVEDYGALADDLERLGSDITIVAPAMNVIACRMERESAGES